MLISLKFTLMERSSGLPGEETEAGGDGGGLRVALGLPGFPRNWAEPKTTRQSLSTHPMSGWLWCLGFGFWGWVGFEGFGRVGMERIGVVGG